MKREIKFRGKSLKTGNWLVGDLRNPNIEVRNRVFIFPLNEYASIDSHEVNPSTVGQFTGSKDKNGKEIYEGDIVRLKSAYDEYLDAVVIYDCRRMGFEYNTNWCNQESSVRYDASFHSVEVIGNIHDNPEMIKVKI